MGGARIVRRCFGLCLSVLVAAPVVADAQEAEPTITYVGVAYDAADLERLNVGGAGYWFPQWDAPEPVAGRPTGERELDALPPWAAPLNHFSFGDLQEGWLGGEPDPVGCDPADLLAGCIPTFFFRSFSQDGPARSAGGHADWATLTLPDGTTGLSGAVVDPHTAGNSNNTVNRIQLTGDVPGTFYFHVVVDTTDRAHDPVDRLQARGNIGPQDTDETQVDTDVFPNGCDLTFNGTADVYTFRYDGFTAGDYLKLRLAGGEGGASFGGLLFDDHFDPAPGSYERAPRGGPAAESCL